MKYTMIVVLMLMLFMPTLAQEEPETTESPISMVEILGEDNPLSPFADVLVTMLGASMGLVWILSSATKWVFKTLNVNYIVAGWTLLLGIVYIGSYYTGITDETWQASLKTLTEIGLGILTLGGVPVLTGVLYRGAKQGGVPGFGYSRPLPEISNTEKWDG